MARAPFTNRTSRLGAALLAGAIALPALIMAGNGYLSWRQAWRDADHEIGRTADTAAEYALRVFEGHRLRLDRINDMLRGLGDGDIRARERELHEALRDFALRDGAREIAFYVFDRDSRPLVSSSSYPVQDVPVPAREFHTALRAADAPAVHISPIYVGTINRVPYFAISRRRDGTGNAVPQGGYDGIISISVYVSEANTALKRILDDDRDVLNLLRGDGNNLARSAGFGNAAFPVRIRPDGPISTAIAEGLDRFSAIGAASLDGIERQFAYRRVAGWPVYALVARPVTSIGAQWRRAMVPQLLIGVPAWLGLIALALLVRRSQGELERRVFERTAGLTSAAAALRQGEERLRLAHEAAGIGYWDYDASTGLTDWSREMYPLYGLEPERDAPMSHQRYFSEIVYADDRAKVLGAAAEAMKTGSYECEYRVWRRTPGGGRELRWIVGRGRVVSAADGTSRRILGANVDMTARREAEEQEALLMREVDHRAKNVLAVVLSLLRLTPREDTAGFAASVEGRVAAMARVHTLLAEGRWIGAELEEIVEAELQAYAMAGAPRAAPRVEIGGPAVRLAPHVAQAMSVVLHELATNAAKYGALSVPDGRVEVSWTLAGADRLRLVWTESGGPPVPGPPTRQGFGSRLIASTVRRQLGGEVELDWAPGGLHCVIHAPTGVGAAGDVASAAAAAD